ncbi:hypothetical protein P7D98_00730 [Enterococcus avium]|uniref:hypothetical protein n=1 Tax=Enterococcus avium TaxID=33945 RepID=UPI0028901B3E|nr:hypothetical protein [Enterococcus avium]MDT2464396.1 hypothetical protein [Enterococcus avium]MDT2503594.1 hypothetical protein [Enterococcus avium]
MREEIIDRMVVSDFYQEESLNFDLFEYLLNRPTKFAVYIKVYLKMIKRRSKFRFIIEAFLKYSIDSQKNLILMLSKFDETIFRNLFFNAQASNSELNEIAICLLSELNENQLSIFENDEESHDRFFLDFLEQSTDLLPTIKIINDNMLLNIIKLSPKFKNIDFFVLKSKLRKVIYENWLYEINYENIYSAINYYFEKMDDSVVKNQAFTIITQMSDTNLLNYIESAENLNTFVEMYISNSNERIGDEPKIAYQLINNRFLNNPLTSKYIISLETNKLELNQITYDNFYPVVISNGKALPTETNIINYFIFKDNVWTNYLIDFIVHGSEDYSFDVDKAKSILDETGQLDSFINETVTTNTIPDVYYKDILSKLNAFYPSFGYNNISLDKVEILLNLEIIGFTESSLQTFRNHYSEKLIHFILDNIDPYIEYISEVGNYNLEEMSEVLFHSKELSSDKQKELINCFDSTDTISIRETSFESDVLTLVLATHFDIEEIDYICEKYDEESEKVKKEIYNIISENLSILINDEFNIPRELLIKILADENFSLEDRQLLMSKNLDELDLKELPSVLVSLKLSKHATLFNSKNPSFEKNETNKNILSYLVQKRVISSFREIDGKYKAYNRRKKLDIEFLD